MHPQHVVMAAASSGKDVECPRYTLMLDAPDLAAALMRQMPPSASVTRQFVTSCEALKRKRYTCKIELEREWDQPVHRKVGGDKDSDDDAAPKRKARNRRGRGQGKGGGGRGRSS